MNGFDAAMAELRVRFVARAAEDLRKLRDHQRGMPLSRRDLRALVHRIAGSAGLFGFAEISTLAGRVDERLVDRDDVADLSELVMALQALVLECGTRV